RAGLHRGGHDHDAVRHGDAQRPRPLPPGDGRDRPRPRPGRAGRPFAPGHGRQAPGRPGVDARARRGPAGGDRLDVERVLVVNAGSSSLKLRLLGPDDDVLADREVERWDGDPAHADIAGFVRALDGVDAVGHRVVHGGSRFHTAAPIDDDVLAAIEDLTPLAPLHQPPAVAGIKATRGLLPDVPAVACFDTAFHATMPASASTYALP